MAQETAGTIGIPVLKNEILPYMADYQRRRDRYAALEAQREAKLADLEYKRQMEREKSVTALPGVAGNYYSGILQQMQTADLDEMQRAAKDPSVPFGALNQKGAIVKTENETRNNIANQRSKEIDETVKQAGQYGVRITPDLIGMHLSQRWGTAPTRDSRFFGESDAEQIFGKAVGDINNVNLNRLGEAMIGKSKEKIEQIETPDRKSDSFQYYDVFKPVKQKGTVAGIDVLSAGPVDIDRADAIFRSDPIASTIRDNAVKQMITANKANPNFAVLDAIQQEREAKQAFYDQVFANYKGQTKYVRSLEQGRAGRAGGGADKQSPSETAGTGAATVPVFTKKTDGTYIKLKGFPQKVSYGSPKDRVYPVNGTMSAGPDVYLLQDLDEASQEYKDVTANILKANKNGTYNLAQGVKFTNPTKRNDIFFAADDIIFSDPTGKVQKYTVKAGTVLDNKTALKIIALPSSDERRKLVKRMKGYEVEALVPYTFVDPTNDKTRTTKEAAIRMFIPEEKAAAIKSYINKSEKTGEVFTPTQGEFSIFRTKE